MMRKITTYSLLFLCTLLGLSGCSDGILDTGMYDGKLPAVNFTAASSKVDETESQPVSIPLYIHGEVLRTGSIRVKVTPGEGVVYGEDFTTVPAVSDGYIDFEVLPGTTSLEIRVAVSNDLESIEDKKISFALCESRGGIQTGGKYGHELTIVNKNNTVSGLIITTDPEEIPGFGVVENGQTSAPEKITVFCEGLTDHLVLAAPKHFKLSLEKTGMYMNAIEIPLESFAGGQGVDVWVVFAPESGMDGMISGTIKLTTAGTSGISIPVNGKESGNSGPYTFISQFDGFWNAGKGVIGSKVLMDWTTSADGDLYIKFDLSALKKEAEELGKIELLLMFRGEQAGVLFSAFDIPYGDLVQGNTLKPARTNLIPSLTDLTIDLLQNEFTTIDVTEFVKSHLAAGRKQFAFGLYKKSGADAVYAGNHKNGDEAEYSRIIIYDK